MQISSPLVSIVMPVYNASPYLSEAIKSILEQSYKKFEFIIIDDSSTDNSLEILKSFNDDRIKIYSLEKNSGNFYCRNYGIAKSTGEFIATMDSDDISLPLRIEKQVHHLLNNPDVHILGTWVYTMDENGKILKELKNEINSDIIRVKSLLTMEFFNPTVMFRKEVFFEYGYNYNDTKSAAQDFALLSKLVIKYNSSNLPEFLLKYRKSSTQISQRNKLQQSEYFVDAIVENLQGFGIEISSVRRDLIKLITRNHEQLPVLVKDLINLKKLIADIVHYNEIHKTYNSAILNIFLRQTYLDRFQNYEGNFYNYCLIYFQMEFAIFKSISSSGLLKLTKRGFLNFTR